MVAERWAFTYYISTRRMTYHRHARSREPVSIAGAIMVHVDFNATPYDIEPPEGYHLRV